MENEFENKNLMNEMDGSENEEDFGKRLHEQENMENNVNPYKSSDYENQEKTDFNQEAVIFILTNRLLLSMIFGF